MKEGYELLYLIPSTKSQEEVKEIQKKVEELLNKEGAEILDNSIWIQGRLAYKIKKVENAYYVLCYFKTKRKNAPEIKRKVMLMTDILRSMMLRHDDIVLAMEQFKKSGEKREKGSGIIGEKEKDLKKPIARKPSAYVKEEKTQAKKEETKKEDEPTKQEESPEEKKASIEDLDKRLEDILGEDIDL